MDIVNSYMITPARESPGMTQAAPARKPGTTQSNVGKTACNLYNARTVWVKAIAVVTVIEKKYP